MHEEDPEVAKYKQSVIDVGQRTQLELLQAEVRHNKECLTALRLENKRLNVILQQAQRGQRRGVEIDPLRREEEQLHNKLCLLKRSLNSVHGKKEELTKEIARTVEETGYILQEGKFTTDNSAMGQKIRGLENRLDKCLIKHNEVNAIRRTYEALLERLQQEQAGFDTQLAAMEKTLQNKEKDLCDLNTVAAEASNGRDAAKAEVLRLKAQLTRERRAQNKDLEERRAFVMTKQKQLDRKAQRLKDKIERDEERRAGQHMAGGNQQKKVSRVTTQKPERREDVEQQQQLREAYNKLKEVTMSNTVDEVISKLQERQDANAQLMQTAEEAEEADAMLKEERSQLMEEWEKLQQQNVVHRSVLKGENQKPPATEERTTGGANSVANVAEQRALVRRRVLEEFESYLNDRKNELNVAQRVQEGLGQLLMDLGAGVQRLADTVACATINVMSASTHVSMFDEVCEDELAFCNARGDSIVSVLNSTAAKLENMLELVDVEDVASVATSIYNWRYSLPPTNVCIRLETSATPADGGSGELGSDHSDSGGVSGKGRRTSADEMPVGCRRWFGPAPTDDFPENEIHDRHELKQMSIATVERERKKARKLQQQRVKDETI
ncbi:uncharacterized protein TEOVI_000309600 [Trypanosoma equiperdum]|uniref:ODAD1 central coiled coil region domain-containing protein n=4 Tax=Trypanozoon TaxID=39700 RepID=Q57ZQ9_TRYB2|nr:hypothetical protein, conserved [Trypanosoma brucei brucei TREU927]AAX79107.1 hypothetical protein, conserved [Trypanosoma brucei]AAZ11305.1 hypothetical protein, conserved [Trypanosoma brucei brucei TREU927]SCU71515.1 hypothetical protein, conserved [Trypanosoma equiperdum]